MKLDDRFNSTQFAVERIAAATALKNKTSFENAEDVFDFFDTVGLLVRVEALKAEIAHSLFFHWINLYWCSGEQYIKDKQKESNLT